MIKKMLFFILSLLLLISCTPYRKSMYEVKGSINSRIYIYSEPTEAHVYINSKDMGLTPFKTDLYCSDGKSMINIKAVPVNPNQFTQNLFINVPPIPNDLTIYMDNNPNIIVENWDDIDIDTLPSGKNEQYKVKRDTIKIHDPLPFIYFDYDKYDINDSETTKLAQVINLLEKNPKVSIETVGSADLRGSEKYNIDLSLKRSKAVADYIINHGINKKRVMVRATGKIKMYDTSNRQVDFQESRIVYFKIHVNK